MVVASLDVSVRKYFVFFGEIYLHVPRTEFN
jgi:hypothetical protein